MNLSMHRLILAAPIILATSCQTIPAAGSLTSRQVAVLRSNGFVETSRGWEFDMTDRLLFDSDKAEIRPGEATALMKIARALVAVELKALRVEGHADSTGTPAGNQLLSERRAAAVADVLARGGVPRAGLTIIGLGDTAPVESNATVAGRAENRRVVIIVPTPEPLPIRPGG